MNWKHFLNSDLGSFDAISNQNRNKNEKDALSQKAWSLRSDENS